MKYTIVKVNDRATENVERTRLTMRAHEYVDTIPFCTPSMAEAQISARGIRDDVWNPFVPRDYPRLPGELGVWGSALNCWDYMINNKVDHLLVLEDDAILATWFPKMLSVCLDELPTDYDFLALWCCDEQGQVTESTDLQSHLIQRSWNQFAGTVAMLYSHKGAERIMETLRKKGIEDTLDCFLFRASQLGLVNGFSLAPAGRDAVQHGDSLSTIDPEGIRPSPPEAATS